MGRRLARGPQSLPGRELSFTAQTSATRQRLTWFPPLWPPWVRPAQRPGLQEAPALCGRHGESQQKGGAGTSPRPLPEKRFGMQGAWAAGELARAPLAQVDESFLSGPPFPSSAVPLSPHREQELLSGAVITGYRARAPLPACALGSVTAPHLAAITSNPRGGLPTLPLLPAHPNRLASQARPCSPSASSPRTTYVVCSHGI